MVLYEGLILKVHHFDDSLRALIGMIELSESLVVVLGSEELLPSMPRVFEIRSVFCVTFV